MQNRRWSNYRYYWRMFRWVNYRGCFWYSIVHILTFVTGKLGRSRMETYSLATLTHRCHSQSYSFFTQLRLWVIICDLPTDCKKLADGDK